MKKFLWRGFVLILLVAAFIPSIAATKTTIFPLLFVSVISILFLILELPSKGIIVFIQERALRFIIASVILFGAFFFYQQGLSEFSTPFIPKGYLSRILIETIRDLLGNTFMAILFYTLSLLFTMIGFNYLLTGRVEIFGKNYTRQK